MGDIRHNFADLTKNSKLSFVPQVSFEQGIKKFTDWVLQQEVQEDNLRNFGGDEEKDYINKNGSTRYLAIKKYYYSLLVFNYEKIIAERLKN